MDAPKAPLPPGWQALAGSDYRLDQLVAVPNWRAVLWTGTQHVTQRVYLLALATAVSSQEPGLLVGLTYDPAGGWAVAELDAAYCGLLPPDWDLVPFESLNACGHTPEGSHG